MRGRFAILAGLGLITGSAGCGAFVTDSGIFPMPTIHLVYPLPSQVGLAFETLTIESPSGPMFGWFIPAKDPRGTIFFSHGSVTNRAAHIAHYQLFHQLGYNVFLYDYQGFGENYNVVTIHNILPDADMALEALQARTDSGTDKIVIFGLSMGTLPSMVQAAREPERVVGVILEGSFIREALSPPSFLALGIQPSALAYTLIPSELDPRENIGRIRLPKLFLQSTDDNVTPYDSALELFDLAADPKFFVQLSGLHTYSVIFDPNYGPRIKEFLDAVTAD